jgi:hypothetical protein
MSVTTFKIKKTTCSSTEEIFNEGELEQEIWAQLDDAVDFKKDFSIMDRLGI